MRSRILSLLVALGSLVAVAGNAKVW